MGDPLELAQQPGFWLPEIFEALTRRGRGAHIFLF
jgi:hypothetical protein